MFLGCPLLNVVVRAFITRPKFTGCFAYLLQWMPHQFGGVWDGSGSRDEDVYPQGIVKVESIDSCAFPFAPGSKSASTNVSSSVQSTSEYFPQCSASMEDTHFTGSCEAMNVVPGSDAMYQAPPGVYVSNFGQHMSTTSSARAVPVTSSLVQGYSQHVSPASAATKKDKSGSTFVCNICGHMFKNKKYLNQHIENQHTKPGRFTCQYCGKNLNSNGARFLHMKRVHKFL